MTYLLRILFALHVVEAILLTLLTFFLLAGSHGGARSGDYDPAMWWIAAAFPFGMWAFSAASGVRFVCGPITILMYGVGTASMASWARISTLNAVIATILAAVTATLLVIYIRHVRDSKDAGSD